MDAFDVAVRLVVIGQFSVVALVLAVRSPPRVSVPMALLFLCISAYLLKSSDTIRPFLGPTGPALFVMAMSIPYLVWVCAWALFDFEVPRPVWLIGLPLIGYALCGGRLMVEMENRFLQLSMHFLALVPLAHAVLMILRGNLDAHGVYGITRVAFAPDGKHLVVVGTRAPADLTAKVREVLDADSPGA